MSDAISAIKRAVCHHYGIKQGDLTSADVSRAKAFPRQMAMYLCRRFTGLSFPQIGREFGDRDHTTVMYACRKIEGWLDCDEETRDDLAQLVKALSANPLTV